MGTDIAGAYVGGFIAAGRHHHHRRSRSISPARTAWDTLAGGTSGNEPAPPSQAMGFGFGYGYYVAGTALVQALTEAGTTDPEALQAALADLELDVPYGPVTLDENRQGIIDTFVAQLVLDEEGEVVQQTKYIVPGVDQTFGYLLERDGSAGTGQHALRRAGTPVAGQSDRRRRRRTAALIEPAAQTGTQMSPNDTSPRIESQAPPLLRLESVAVSFGALRALGGVDLDVVRGERLAVLGPNGAGKTTLFNVIAGDISPTEGRVLIKTIDCTSLPSRCGPSSAWPGRTRREAAERPHRSRTTCTSPRRQGQAATWRCGGTATASARTGAAGGRVCPQSAGSGGR